MENNEQNNFEATNNVNPVNNVEPTPTVESTPEVKTEDTIMVAEPAVRPAVEPTPAPVAPAPQPMPAPEVSSRPEPVVETTPVQPTVEPEPVVIPKGEKPKKNNKGVVTLLLILILIVLAVCGYFVYDKYVKDLITKPNTNETANNNQANNNVPEPTNDEGIFGELAVKNQKLEYEDSKSKSYTFDIYLDDKMVVEGLVYGEAGGNAGQISLNKMGYLKDTVIDAKYLAFFVKHAPGAHVPSTLFIIDKDGKIVFQRKGTSDGQYKIEETGEYAGGTTYKLDEDANRVLYYVISDSIEERSVQISSGSPVDETYKTYAKNTNTNQQVNNLTDNDVSAIVDEYYKYFDGQYSLINMLSNFSESTKAGIAFRNLSYADNNIKEAIKETAYDEAKELVSYTDLNSNYKKMFGEDTDLSKDVKLDTGACVRTRYTSDTDSYVGSAGSCCGCDEPSGYYYVDKYNEDNDNLYVTLNYISFVDSKLSNADGIMYNGEVTPLTYEQVHNKEFVISNYKNMFSRKFKLTFKNINGKYILVSSEEV